MEMLEFDEVGDATGMEMLKTRKKRAWRLRICRQPEKHQYFPSLESNQAIIKSTASRDYLERDLATSHSDNVTASRRRVLLTANGR